MVIQGNTVGLEIGLQSTALERPEAAVQQERTAPAVKKEPGSEDAASISLSEPSKRLNQAKPLDKTLPSESERISEDEAAEIVDTASSSIARDPAQAVSAQANQDPARVTALVQ